MNPEDFELYYVPDPIEAIGVPNNLKWAVSYRGDWAESFKLKREAQGYIDAHCMSKEEK